MTRPRLSEAVMAESDLTTGVPRLLWGWPDVIFAANLPRRTLERELAAGRFPKPIRRVGRRPFWRPVDVVTWAEGGDRS
jgi:hypothetical protein